MQLQHEVVVVGRRVARLISLLRLVVIVLKASGAALSRTRLPEGTAKPKVGIRASKANEIWHVDTTLIRLLDGSGAYLHAVIDNFSRRILAWRVADCFNPGVTAQLLRDAAPGMTSDKKYFGTGTDTGKQLEASRIAARQSRLVANRAQTCQSCEKLVSTSSSSP